MSDVATLIADMVKGGVDADLIGRVAAALVDAKGSTVPVENSNDKRRERNRRYYEKRLNSDDNKTISDDQDAETSKPPFPASSPSCPPDGPPSLAPEPPKPIPPLTPLPSSSSPQTRSVIARPEGDLFELEVQPTAKQADQELLSDFDVFWMEYPSKKAKPKAVESYRKARKKATAQEILRGLEAYKQHKPPDRSWLNPTTFLNQQRWTDEHEPGQHQSHRQTSGERNHEGTMRAFDLADQLFEQRNRRA